MNWENGVASLIIVSPGFSLPFVREQYVNSLYCTATIWSLTQKIKIFFLVRVCRVAVKLVVQLLAGRRVAFTRPVK